MQEVATVKIDGTEIVVFDGNGNEVFRSENLSEVTEYISEEIHASL